MNLKIGKLTINTTADYIEFFWGDEPEIVQPRPEILTGFAVWEKAYEIDKAEYDELTVRLNESRALRDWNAVSEINIALIDLEWKWELVYQPMTRNA